MKTLSHIRDELTLIKRDLNSLIQINSELKQEASLLELGIEYKSAKFFIERIKGGKVLLVGEGNLSFARCLVEQYRIPPRNITATTYEDKNELSDKAKSNTIYLDKAGTLVLHSLDARHVHKVFFDEVFSSIIFQFPNSGSRGPIRGRNPNFVLIKDFLKSAAHCLNKNGKVMVTTVDSPHYAGAFQLEEAAEKAGYHSPKSYAFDPKDFSGYSHVNTNDEDSALSAHKKFLTWIFHPKA